MNDALDKSIKSATNTLSSLEGAKNAVVSNTEPKDKDDELNARLEEAVHSREMRRQEREAGQLKLKEIEHKHQDQIANREMRQKYSRWVYYYLVGYSIVVGLFVFLSATKWIPFEIENDVLNVLVGSTAVSAIGLVYAVTHGLFSPKNNTK